MRRFAFAIVVALLTFSVSGMSSFVLGEPCTGLEQPGQNDAACPPTCVTCGCCAQAAESIAVVVSPTPDVPIADIPDVLPGLPRTSPRDILHVPKLRVA